MTYQELIDNIPESRNIPNTDAKKNVQGIFDTLKDETGNDIGVSIPEIGTFTTIEKDLIKVYSYRHKKYMIIPPKRAVDFTSSFSLKNNLKLREPGDE